MSPPDAPAPKGLKVEAPKAPKVEAPKAPKVPKAQSVPSTHGPTERRRRQIAATPQSPLLKVLVPVIAVVVLVAGIVLLYERLKSGPTAPHSESVFALEKYQCIVPPTQIIAELSTLDVVPCSVPHTQQVYDLIPDTKAGDNYPGASILKTFADGQCLNSFKSFVGKDYRDSSLFYTYLLPSVRSWAQGDRTVTCLIFDTTGTRRSTFQNSDM